MKERNIEPMLSEINNQFQFASTFFQHFQILTLTISKNLFKRPRHLVEHNRPFCRYGSQFQIAIMRYPGDKYILICPLAFHNIFRNNRNQNGLRICQKRAISHHQKYPKENKNNAYAKFWRDKQRVLCYFFCIS